MTNQKISAFMRILYITRKYDKKNKNKNRCKQLPY